MSTPRRLRMAARLLLRSLGLRASKFALALLAVIAGVSIAATALDLRSDLASKVSRELRVYGPNLLLVPKSAFTAVSATGQADAPAGRVHPATLDLDRAVSAVGSLRGGTIAAPLLYVTGHVGGEGVVLTGIDIAPARSLWPTWRVEGEWPDDWNGDGPADGDRWPACLLGSRVAERLRAEPGSRITVDLGEGASAELAVAGVVATGESEEDQILVPLPLLQRLAVRDGRISAMALRIEGGVEEVERAGDLLEAGVPGSESRPLRQVTEAEGRLIGRLDLMMTLLGGLVLATSVLCVMTTLVSVVVERESEIGLMRSLGARDGEILFMILGEATLIGAAGGALGFALGALNAHLVGLRLFGAAVKARPEILPAVIGLAVLVCWIGVIAPLKRALSIQPAAALRGE